MQILKIKNVQILLFTISLLVSGMAFSQQPNEYYKSVANNDSLASVFPVNDIVSITVTNFSGTHTLTKSELLVLKQQLSQSRFAGGLLVKPGHASLSIRLAPTSKAKPGYVYVFNGMVNFDGGLDKSGNRFSGSYYLPLSVNFDNYK